MSILYGAPLSPFVRKVAIVLEEKNIAYDWQMVRPHSDLPAFAAISPLGKIPAYQDEDIGISDSSVICQYLEKKHPAPALYPQSPVDFARTLWLEEYFDGSAIKPMRAIFAERFSNPTFFKKPTDEARVSENDALLQPMLAYIESVVPADGWVMGDFSMADIALCIGFANLHISQWTLNAAHFPKLVAHLTRCIARPSFVRVAKAMDSFVQKL